MINYINKSLLAVVFTVALSACSSSSNPEPEDETPPDTTSFTVNAGADQQVNAGVTVLLNGVSSLASADVASYLWQQQQGNSVTLSNADAPAASFVAPSAVDTQQYTFQLSITDTDGNNVTDTITIMVNGAGNGNTPPLVDAGSDMQVLGRSLVENTASASDTDGSIVSYEWRQLSGKTVQITDTNAETLRFETPLVIGTLPLSFELTVTDNQGATASDTINITVTEKGSKQVLSAVGMSAAGFPDDYVYYSVSTPAIGRSGHVAFTGVADTSIFSTDNASNALWGGMPDQLELIIQEDDPVDGLPTNILFGTAGRNAPTVTQSGYIGFFAGLKGAAQGPAILAKTDDGVTTVMRVATAAPGFPSTTFITSLNSFLFTDAGMLISGSVNPNTTALWFWDFNTIELIAVADAFNQFSLDEETLGTCPYAGINGDRNILYSFGGHGLSQNGHVAFTAIFTDDDNCSSALRLLGWKKGSGTYSISASQDPIENISEGLIFSVSLLDINDNGDVLMGTDIRETGSPAKSANWLVPYQGTPQPVAIDGELVANDFSKNMLFLAGSKFILSNSSTVSGIAVSSPIGAVLLDVSLLSGSARSNQPYTSFSSINSSNSQLDLILRGQSVPTGYSSASIISFESGDDSALSTNDNDDLFIQANVMDAETSQTHSSIWHIKNAGTMTELVKVGDTIRVNGNESALSFLFFNGGSITQGKTAQLDDSGRLFIQTRADAAYQANVLITPAD